MLRTTSLVVVLMAFFGLAKAQGTCDIDADCKPGQCCSSYGYCGSGPDYCRAGCILEDVEILGGDLDLSNQNGRPGIFADRDDSCAKQCEDNPACQFWTFNVKENRCFLKFSRPTLRQSNTRGLFISGSTRDDGCEVEPPCLPPKKILNGVCTFAPTAPPVVVFTTRAPTSAAPAISTTSPEPVFIPNPPRPSSPPKKLATLPTLPPKIASKTFISPPVIQNTFQGAFDYCTNLGAVLPSFDFFDIFNIEEAAKSSGNSSPRINETTEETEVEVDTSVDFVDKQIRVKRQFSGYDFSRGHWYWISNYNDGRTCYAALPGDSVRFRAFKCTDILRVICQKSQTDSMPVFKFNRNSEPLQNQIPELVIRANPKKPFFAKSGLTNPYLNHHARIFQRRRQMPLILQKLHILQNLPPAPNQLLVPN